MSNDSTIKPLNLEEREWPALSEDGKVPSKEFLNACDTIVVFFGGLGKIFSPVRKDIEGNVTKLRNLYSKDTLKYEYIHDLIISEIRSGEGMAIESLLWLKRGLHFTCRLLLSLVDDHHKSVREESLSSNLQIAYEVSLKEYHNWVIQKFFTACTSSRMCPKRSELLKTLAGNNNQNCTIQKDEIDGLSHANIVIPKLDIFAKGLESNLKSIFELYVKNGLDTKTFE